jgi:tRNA threonylcarbamoyl adenosine modification protein (Sua5/YciO/YrdC/YwlC family)
MSGVIDVATAIELLSKGGVVALPTDTVYGVAASLRDPEAIAKLFALKRRPSSAPLPILVDSIKQVTRLGVVWPEEARMLASAFWPGALTIVVHVPHELALRVSLRYRARMNMEAHRAQRLDKCSKSLVIEVDLKASLTTVNGGVNLRRSSISRKGGGASSVKDQSGRVF